jgi:hypothetical protein
MNASLARTSGIGNRAAALLRTRWLVRAPIWLYRARLGFVFRPQLLMLEHRGRKTGARRYVVLEIVGHPAPVPMWWYGDSATGRSGIAISAPTLVYVSKSAAANRWQPLRAGSTPKRQLRR